MPRWDYRCSGCGTVAEEERAVAARDEPRGCERPGCAGTRKREFNAASPVIAVPMSFRKHIHTTGLKSLMGGGPWEDVKLRGIR